MSRPPGSRGSSGERSAGLREGNPREQTLLTPCLQWWGCWGQGPCDLGPWNQRRAGPGAFAGGRSHRAGQESQHSQWGHGRCGRRAAGHGSGKEGDS